MIITLSADAHAISPKRHEIRISVSVISKNGRVLANRRRRPERDGFRLLANA